MALTGLNPYLNFEGTAEQAIAHYERTLGAKPEMVMRYRDVQGMDVPPEHKDLVMHATLLVEGAKIMVSDGHPGGKVTTGDSVHVALHFSGDMDDMARKFAALAEGGQVTQPLVDTFWGAKFGTLVDPFGIRWMFNGELPKA
jgi:PhnB protein